MSECKKRFETISFKEEDQSYDVSEGKCKKTFEKSLIEFDIATKRRRLKRNPYYKAINFEEFNAKASERERKFGTIDKEIELNPSLATGVRDISEIKWPDFDLTSSAKIRSNTFLLVGTGEMSLDDIFCHFKDCPPEFIEWINDNSCLLIYDNVENFQYAIENMSYSFDEIAKAIDDSHLVENQEISNDQITHPTKVWRICKRHYKSPCLFIRQAYFEDIKIFSAAKYSIYYLKNKNGANGIVTNNKRKQINELLNDPEMIKQHHSKQPRKDIETKIKDHSSGDTHKTNRRSVFNRLGIAQIEDVL